MSSAYVNSCCGSAAQLETKGAAIALALMMATDYCEAKNTRRTNYKKAQKIFDFICRNVNLPDVKSDPMDGLNAQLGGLMGILEKTMAEKYTPTAEKEVSES